MSTEDELPKAIVKRILRGSLPESSQIQKDAILAVSEAAKVFVFHASMSPCKLILMNLRIHQFMTLNWILRQVFVHLLAAMYVNYL